jgi:hypothetical protein
MPDFMMTAAQTGIIRSILIEIVYPMPMSKLSRACALVLVLASSGCGGLNVIDDRGVTRGVPARPLGKVPPLDLSACVVPDPSDSLPGAFYGFMTSEIPAAFSPAESGDCDVRITAGHWDWTVSAARTGRTLFRVVGSAGVGSNLSSWMARAVYDRLGEARS